MQIPKKNWINLTDSEKEIIVEEVFHHYRSVGFPYYPTDSEYRQNEFRKLKSFDYRNCIDYDNKTIKQTMHGLALAWSYFPHSWSVRCNGLMTPMDLFSDDEKFKAVIRRRMKLGDNISDSGIRKMLKMFSGAQSVSNFRPTAAAAIYSVFSEEGDTVYDMSCGFGGRLIGATIANRKYVGVDPSTKTYKGLLELSRDFNHSANLLNAGSESFRQQENSIDLCFTSPPYFDTEVYADEPTQSCIKYPAKDVWFDGFLADTLSNCHHSLKSGKFCLINIANTKKVPDMVERTVMTAEYVGFKHVDTWQYALSSSTTAGFKNEPILVFRKN